MAESKRLTAVQWTVCVIAAIGFAFDIYELLVLPLIVRPALLELIGAAPGSPEFQMWVGRLFYVPALFGGLFGLLGGYLTDRLGRRRVLTWSILLYAGSALGGRICDLGLVAAVFPLHDVYRRVCRVRGGGGLARRVVPRGEAARGGARLHAGVLVAWRHPGDRGQLLCNSMRPSICRRSTAGTKRGATR